MTPEVPPPPTAEAGPALAALPQGAARLEPGIAVKGAALVFPPRAAWLWVRVALAPGCYRLTLACEGNAPLSAELVSETETLPLPLAPDGTDRTARFALEAPATWLRLMPCEAGEVRLTAFAIKAAAPWRTLLPDWLFGPLRLPVRPDATLPTAHPPLSPPGWTKSVAVVARDGVELDGDFAHCGRAGALRLRFARPLPAGRHVLKARFRDAAGVPAFVAPRLYRDDAPPNTPPLAHFRRRTAGRYKAVIDLDAPADHLVFQPRQERGEVRVVRLRLEHPSPLMRPFARLGEGWRAHRHRLFGSLGHLLVGFDASADGPLRRVLRLFSLADRRYRRVVGREEKARIAGWLARPVLRPGRLHVAIMPGPAAAVARTRKTLAACGDHDVAVTRTPATADLVLPAGTRVAPHALAALRRAPPGGSPLFDTDRVTLGLRSAPEFRAPAADGARATIPLILARRPGAAGLLPAAPEASPASAAATPAISLVTATRDAADHVERFLDTFASTRPRGTELVLLDNATTDPAALALLERARAMDDVRVVSDDRPFNFAALSNHGARLARGDVLVFANNDIAFRHPGWAEALSGALAADPGRAIAGARLEYPDGRIQHAGLILAGEARVRHLERFADGRGMGYFGRWHTTSEVTAVTGALMAVRRDAFEALGGFAAERYPVLYNDVDLCLRARRAGWTTVLCGTARAVHHESVSFNAAAAGAGLRGRGGALWRMERAEEADRFRQDWAALLDADPCYPHACDPVEAAYRVCE